MKIRNIPAFALLFVLFVGAAHAADLAGKWNSKFDSQIGEQKYVYDFKNDDGKLTGKATRETSLGNGTIDLTDIKLDGDKVSFLETLSIEGNNIVITYTGTITGDEMKLRREVGEFAVEDIVAHRANP
jgi:hypothetical protein